MKNKDNYTILLVDDEPAILDFLKYNIQKEGYSVLTATNGEEALEVTFKLKPDLILLDLMMPMIDGIEVCKTIREKSPEYHPIIAFLTSRNEDYSHIAGFDSGADDYITKPIRPRLLISKITALLRRLSYGNNSNEKEQNSEIVLNREKFIIFKNNEQIVLAKKEFELLEFLMSKPEKVFNRDEILSSVWGNQTIVGERTVDVHIRKLREKLGGDYIRTTKGIGYTFINREKK